MTTRNLFAALLVAVLATAPAAIAVGAPVCGTFDVVAGPDATGGSASLLDVAVQGDTVWAIGEMRRGTALAATPFAARLVAGGSWHYELLPELSLKGGNAAFEGIAAAPNGDVWIVGHSRDRLTGVPSPVVLRHRRGFWTEMTIDSAEVDGPRGIALRDVAAVSADDVWAAGEATDPASGVASTVFLRFDGDKWHEAKNGSSSGLFAAVSAAANSKVAWAVGHEVLPSLTLPEVTVAAVSFWNGAEWGGISHPAMRPGTRLADVVAIAENDIWAVGQDGAAGLFLHFDGREWKEYLVPAAAPVAVSAIAGDDVWAVGRDAFHHFDGQSWMTIPATNHPAASARRAIAVAGPCSVYAVGSLTTANGEAPLVESMKDPGTTQVPVAPASVTAASPSHDTAIVGWKNAGDATDFVIERCEDEAYKCELSLMTVFKVIAKVSGAASSYRDGDVKAETDYTYRLRAANKAGMSPYSATASVRTPAAPTHDPGPDVVAVPSHDPGPDVVPTTSVQGVPAPVRPTRPAGKPAPGPGTTSVQGLPAPAAPTTSVQAPAPVRPQVAEPLPPYNPVCVATSVEVIVHRANDARLATSTGLEVVLRDARGFEAAAGCLPVKWTKLDEAAPFGIAPSRDFRYASVAGKPGVYGIRVIVNNGLSTDVVLTLD
jgi:hypothetical protein